MAKPISDLEKLKKTNILKILGVDSIFEIKIVILKKLKEMLKKLKDEREQGKIIYKQWDVIMCVILSSFADNNDWGEIEQFVTDNYKWFKSFLQMTGGIPDRQTYERVMSKVNSDELNNLLIEFYKELISIYDDNNDETIVTEEELKLLNLDGRVNNGSSRKETIDNEAVKGLNSLNGYSNELGYCVISKMIDEKSNEIPAVEEVVSDLDLQGYTVTWDALNTQKTNVKAVIDSGGDYCVPVKANQKQLMEDLIDYFNEERLKEIKNGDKNSEYLIYNEKSHGCNITYENYQTSDIDWYDKKNDWAGLQSFGFVRKTIEKAVLTTKIIDGKKVKTKEIKSSTECRYYISSKEVNIKEFSETTRKHWNIEDKVHWHLDYTFRQDSNTTKNKTALFNLEIIHKFALAVLSKIQSRYEGKSLKNIRKHLSNNIEENFPALICNLVLSH